MYDFILQQWILGKYTAAQVNKCVTKGWITQEEYQTIINTPQVV